MAYEILSDSEKRKAFESNASAQTAGVDIDVLILLQKLRQLISKTPSSRPRDSNLDIFTNPPIRLRFFGRLTGSIYHQRQDCPEMGGISVNLSSHEVSNRIPCRECISDSNATDPYALKSGNSFFSKSSSFGFSTFPSTNPKASDAKLDPTKSTLSPSLQTSERSVQSPVALQVTPGVLLVCQTPKPVEKPKELFTYYTEPARKKFHSNQSCWALQNAMAFGGGVVNVSEVPRKDQGWHLCDICAMSSS
eukprot:TRINITY_DN3395_c0_g2_i3.p1 TRINITY_DN3395_c0_g2~~TRINITY_DN3395_c0_g2_i3.p1  ORF type:complete len:249 (-),score=58.84 TRINITY_DN3395_c0_g2_i3:150-896(-)